MKKLSLRLMLLSLTLSFGMQASAQSSWVATDNLGRTLPTAEECPLKTDKPRTVGIFYITWHTPNLHDGKPYTYDVTKLLEENPERSKGNPDFPYATYHWGEPEYGYFLSQDRYVCFHDLSMLADAGVDVLIMDVTNAVCYWDEWEVLFQTMQEMKALGNKVPKFCFWAFNGNVIDVVQSLYERFYKTPRYQDCWFYWDGKPLLLYNATPSVDANPNGGQKGKTEYSEEVKQFFTLRNMWWGYHSWAGAPYVGGEDKWSFGYEMNDKKVAALKPEELCSKHQGRMEEMAVTPAQHPISITGKSWRRETLEPELDGKDMPKKAFVPWLGEERDNPTQYGIYFQDRWDEALQVDPDFIYLNDWNEWTAGKYKNGKDPSGQADMHIDFLGRKENPFYFVDQYNAEFNRTIAPMKGGWTDNYYMQMVQNIRRYKGVAPMPVHHGYQQIKLDGSLDEWQPDSSFLDTRGDVIHRDHDGYGDHHYTDNSGRNDITRCLVAVDKKNIYFAAETAEPLSPSTDPNWMLLLIDTDEDGEYEYLIQNSILTHSKGSWDVDVAIGSNAVEIAVPRKLLGKTRKKFSLRFKWADNPSNPNDIISLSTTGDTAPNRRFAYKFVWK
ncbi:MAG: hypothetical protein IKQ07_01385 [Bacteroidaceae bacterium]|nr:hypothetical protein [Bacteroidaceae bacterium]